MKLQPKISLTLMAAVFMAAAASLGLINLFILLFDRSYSWADLEKVAIEVTRNLNATSTFDLAEASRKILGYKEDYPNLDFALMGAKREVLFTTFEGPRKHPTAEEMQKRLEEEEKRIQANQFSLRFVDTMDRSPFMVFKPVVTGGDHHGMLMVSVKKDFFLPFYIRINDDKVMDMYGIVFFTIAATIFISFLLVFLFTSPLIRRLGRLYSRMDAFTLDKPETMVLDPKNDEISHVQNTFNRMAERIQQDYAVRMRFFSERQELLKNISHDFRTPLTSILGYAISLDEGVYDNEEEQKRYFSIIRKKAEYMTRLFDEMMELTRLDNDTYVLKTTRFNLAELAREILIEYLPQLEAAGFSIETGLPETQLITGDKERLSRAIRNLVDNVLTHAAAGKYLGLFLSAPAADNAADRRIRLELRDRGPGVPAESAPRIFERFYSVVENGGMGLGLAIAREIIEKHGGTIAADTSAPGLGIIVELPV